MSLAVQANRISFSYGFLYLSKSVFVLSVSLVAFNGEVYIDFCAFVRKVGWRNGSLGETCFEKEGTVLWNNI